MSKDKCPKCGAEIARSRVKSNGHTIAVYACGRDADGSTHDLPNCLRNQLTAKTRECEQAQAACAEMHKAINDGFRPAHKPGCLWLKDKHMPCQCGSADRERVTIGKLRAIRDADNPGQPILDRLTKVEADNADLTAACKALLHEYCGGGERRMSDAEVMQMAHTAIAKAEEINQ